LSFVAGERLDRNKDALHHVFDRIVIERQHQLSGLDLRQIEYVVDQAKQVLAVGLDALLHAAHLVRRLAVNAVEDKLGITEDRIERGAQFVAHIGEELRLVLACFLDLPALFLDFLEQPDVFDGDHRLVGEGIGELNLLLGKWPYYGPT